MHVIPSKFVAEWDDGEKQKDIFFNRMRRGDIVAIKQGAKLIALVQVESSAYEEPNVDRSFDWFDLRRKVVVLDFYQEEYDFEEPQVVTSSLQPLIFF